MNITVVNLGYKNITLDDLKPGEVFRFDGNSKYFYMRTGGDGLVCLETGNYWNATGRGGKAVRRVKYQMTVTGDAD